MSCYLCGTQEYKTILNQVPVPIWTNADDQEAKFGRMACVLRQCVTCGHIYQPMTPGLQNTLRNIYSSHQAQLSTPMGKGNWGQERGRAFLEIFTKMVDIRKHSSILELGCGDGYLLKALQDRGAGGHLAGIEPSLPQTMQQEGITLIRDFAHQDLVLDRKYSLIFSCGVFEHIEDLNSIMRFCVNNLESDGELYISVPDAQQHLQEADPGMFIHEHVQYFTENSLRRFLAGYGFTIKALVKGHGLEVLSQRAPVSIAPQEKPALDTDYEKRLAIVLLRAREVLKQPAVIVHAACNTLNNILGWLNEEFAFTLVDNDASKYSKKYFGKTVRSLQELDLKAYTGVLIMTNAFSGAIREDYRRRGFTGPIEDLMLK